MEYRRLGASGVQVSTVGIDGSTFGHTCGERRSEMIIHRALDAGINFIDTADSHARGLSESFIGRAISRRRYDVVLSTKTGRPMDDGPNEYGLSRRRIYASLEASLRRLGTDYVDIFSLHGPDPDTPVEESLGALDDLIREGKVRYVGLTQFDGWQIADMTWQSKHHGYSRPIISQSPYSILERGIEQEVIPACLHYQMSIVATSSLESDLLTDICRPTLQDATKSRRESPDQEEYLTEAQRQTLAVLESFASERNRTISDLAIAWLLAQPVVCSAVTSVTAVNQVDDHVEAATWKLTDDERAEIDHLLSEQSAEHSSPYNDQVLENQLA